MKTPQEIYDALCMPFMADEVDWRVGSTNKEKLTGLPLAYIDARTAMDRLDKVCGPENWMCNYTNGASFVVCNLGIKMGDSFVWKADGAGATDVEAEKGMLSDAFKRAAVRHGIARYLYELKSGWVPIEPFGKSYRITKDALKSLHELHEEFAQQWGYGSRFEFNSFRIASRCVERFCTTAADAQEFIKSNEGMIALLPVKARRSLMDRLHKIGAAA